MNPLSPHPPFTPGYNLLEGSMPTSQHAIVAALHALVAEVGRDHVSAGTAIWNPHAGTGCIQGVLLHKLGYQFDRTRMTAGGVVEVARALGQLDNPAMLGALRFAQGANDNGAPWGWIDDHFEAVLAGDLEDMEVARLVAARAWDGLPIAMMQKMAEDLTASIKKLSWNVEHITTTWSGVSASFVWDDEFVYEPKALTFT